MAGKTRYTYETFFDCHPYWNERKDNDARETFDTVEYLVNHPTVRKIEANMYHSTSRLHVQPRFRQLTETGSTSLKSSPSLSPASSVSSLRTVFSLEIEENSCVTRRSQSQNPLLFLHSASVHNSQSDKQALKFSLHLSPKLRSKFCEVLSPISDKSQEIGESEPVLMKPTTTRLPLQDRKFRPKSLFSPPSNEAALNSSDSGISISAHSLLSHDALPAISCKPAHLSLENSQGT